MRVWRSQEQRHTLQHIVLLVIYVLLATVFGVSVFLSAHITRGGYFALQLATTVLGVIGVGIGLRAVEALVEEEKVAGRQGGRERRRRSRHHYTLFMVGLVTAAVIGLVWLV